MATFRGIFGAPQTYQTPGIGDGLPGAKPQFDPGLGFGASPAQPQKSGLGFKDIIGIIADGLSGATGGPRVYTQMKLRDRELAQQDQRYQQHRADDWADYQKQWDYQVKNPKPSTAQPYRWEANNGSLFQLGPDGNPQEVYHDPTPKMNFIPDGMGGGQWVTVPTMAPSSQPAPMKPIGKLTPIDGGPSQPATGGFR